MWLATAVLEIWNNACEFMQSLFEKWVNVKQSGSIKNNIKTSTRLLTFEKNNVERRTVYLKSKK